MQIWSGSLTFPTARKDITIVLRYGVMLSMLEVYGKVQVTSGIAGCARVLGRVALCKANMALVGTDSRHTCGRRPSLVKL